MNLFICKADIDMENKLRTLSVEGEGVDRIGT